MQMTSNLSTYPNSTFYIFCSSIAQSNACSWTRTNRPKFRLSSLRVFLKFHNFISRETISSSATWYLNVAKKRNKMPTINLPSTLFFKWKELAVRQKQNARRIYMYKKKTQHGVYIKIRPRSMVFIRPSRRSGCPRWPSSPSCGPRARCGGPWTGRPRRPTSRCRSRTRAPWRAPRRR